MHILIIEDNPAIATNLYDYLEANAHVVDVAHDGEMGLKLVGAHAYDAILLDLGLPRLDGIRFCRVLRQAMSLDTPILILTARDTLDDKLLGFQSGADDYLVKPFALEEVSVRLMALHRRRKGQVARKTLKVGDLSYDPRARRVTCRDQFVAVAPKCLRLIEVLMQDPGRLFSRKELEIEIWGEEQPTSDRLRQHVSILRATLVATGYQEPIETVHGIGYRLVIPDAQS